MPSLKNRSLIVFAAMCLLILSVDNIESAAGATLADLAGTWNFSAMATGPGAPWWGRVQITVKPDGTYTGSETASDSGKAKSIKGAFILSSDGFSMSGAQSHNLLCYLDLGKTVLACTETWPASEGASAGSTNLMIGCKQGAAYTEYDLEGKWQGNFLFSPGPLWARIDETIEPGVFSGPVTLSNGSKGSVSGTLSLSSTGTITLPTCTGECPGSNYIGFMDAGANIIVGTGGAATKAEDAALSVYTWMSPWYSMADLVGVWKANTLASGSGAPWWERSTVTIKSDGTFSKSGVRSNGDSDAGKGTFSISSGGVITVSGVESSDPGIFMSGGKTVIVETNTWSGTTDPGTTEIGIWTKSAGLPWEPCGVSANPGNAQATVSFMNSAANGSAITGYTVIPSVGAPVTGKSSPIIVKGLTNGKSYTFEVTATNGIGTGPPSPVSNAVTPATVPGAPAIKTLTAGNGQVAVSFSAPKSDGGSPITGYVVTSKPTGGIDANAGKTATTHVVCGLKNGTPYTFIVTATNKMGSASSLPSKSITPATVPDAPTNVRAARSDSKAVVTFTAPKSDGGSPIIGYTVASKPAGGKDTDAGKTSTKRLVTGLTNGTAYTFTVTAKNRIGSGPPSQASNIIIPGAGPSVQGTWSLTGEESCIIRVNGYPTRSERVTDKDTFIFNADKSFRSDSLNGTWAQTGSKYTIDVRKSAIDYLEERLASYGIKATFRIDTYCVGGTVTDDKITFNSKITGTFIITSPKTLTGTFSETDVFAGVRSAADANGLSDGDMVQQSPTTSLKGVLTGIIESIEMN